MLFIGGTEGSGTRLLTMLCAKAKMDRGYNLNSSQDAMHIVPFYNRWTRNYLEGNSNNEEMTKHFISCVEKHVGKDDYSNCFIKEPRSLMFLPLIHSVYPNAKFIHIVRSGLSMAFSSNRRHAKHYGDLFTAGANRWSPEIAIKVWNDTNIAAFKYGTEHMGENYLLVKFEDMCAKKINVYNKLVEFIGCQEDIIPQILRKVDIPETWKRGRKQNKEKILEIEKIGKEAIDMFGYQCIHFKK